MDFGNEVLACSNYIWLTNLDYTQEYLNGSVKISFDNHCNKHLVTNKRIHFFIESKSSFARYGTDNLYKKKGLKSGKHFGKLKSKNVKVDLKWKGVYTSSQIASIYYIIKDA